MLLIEPRLKPIAPPCPVPTVAGRLTAKFGVVTERKQGAYHSTGLGLAFCKLAVEAHGGVISVGDGDPVGSVFTFELPV